MPVLGDTLIFLREYPTENAALDGSVRRRTPKY